MLLRLKILPGYVSTDSYVGLKSAGIRETAAQLGPEYIIETESAVREPEVLMVSVLYVLLC